jgi:hypothetical protein
VAYEQPKPDERQVGVNRVLPQAGRTPLSIQPLVGYLP